MKIKILFTLIFLGLTFLTSCAQRETKINGISFVASRQAVEQKFVDPVLKLNANYASVMPFGFIRDLDYPEIIYNTKRQWFGETTEGAKQYIEMLHKNKIQVMLKPHIWIWHGEFTGLLKMNSEEDWRILEDSYRNFILDFAKLAQETECKLFCIGTELELFIVNRTEYWHNLIDEIKAVYMGKLTYAANWDEYKRVPFWNDLDYIGVDAYFPVSESETPTIEESRLGWKPWKDEMQTLSNSTNKKILFTEFGYRSVSFTGKEPWKSDRSINTVNLEAQSNATKALFDEIWNEDWFAGGYLWKWYLNHNEAGGVENSRFTPQNKPAEGIIREYYKNLK